MTDRETKTIELPVSKAIVTLYTYLTHGEYRQIQRELLKGTKIDISKGEDQEMEPISAEAIYDEQDVIMGLLVRSITLPDGDVPTETIPKFVSDLSIVDGNFLFDELNKINSSATLSSAGKKK